MIFDLYHKISKVTLKQSMNIINPSGSTNPPSLSSSLRSTYITKRIKSSSPSGNKCVGIPAAVPGLISPVQTIVESLGNPTTGKNISVMISQK
jgi:hypothetical protein